MEKLDSVIESLFRARDNYATGARTVALLLAAGLGFWIENGLEQDVNPLVLGLGAAGLLSLFSFVANKLRTRRQRPIVLLNTTREQLEELLTSLENYFDHDKADKSRPDTLAAFMISFVKSGSLLKQSNMEPLDGFNEDSEPDPMRTSVHVRIRECVDRVAQLESRSGWLSRSVSWLKDAGSFDLRS